jgi:hypothetical protein
VQFGTGAVHVMPVGSCDIREYRCSESRSLLSAVKEFVYIFRPIWKKSVQEMSIKLFIDFKARKSCTLTDVCAFLSIVSYEICT